MNDKRFDRVEEKLDIITNKIASIDVTLASQHVSLEEHIKRSNMLEAKLQPVEKHVNMVQGALKLILFVAAIAEAIHLLK